MAEISKMLPGYNCGECGYRQCRDYAEEISKMGDISKCPYLDLERFSDTKADIKEYLSTRVIDEHAASEHTVPEHLADENDIEDLPAHCQGCGEDIKEYLSTHVIDEHAASEHTVPEHLVDENNIEDLPAHCQGCGDGIIAFKGKCDYKADFRLGAYPGEPSCREDLYPFARPTDI